MTVVMSFVLRICWCGRGLRGRAARQIRIVNEGAAFRIRWHVARRDVLERLCASLAQKAHTHLDNRRLARAIVTLRSSDAMGCVGRTTMTVRGWKKLMT